MILPTTKHLYVHKNGYTSKEVIEIKIKIKINKCRTGVLLLKQANLNIELVKMFCLHVSILQGHPVSVCKNNAVLLKTINYGKKWEALLLAAESELVGCISCQQEKGNEIVKNMHSVMGNLNLDQDVANKR